MAKSLAVLGHWQMDRKSGEFVCSDEIYRIHGVEPGSVDPTEYMRNAPYHLDDAARLNEARQRALETGESYDLTLRLVRPDGEVRFTRSRANCLFNAQGDVVGLFGVQQDITEEVRLKQEQAATLERLTLAESISGIGFWRQSLLDGEMEWSDAMYVIHDLEPGSIRPRDYAEHATYDPEDHAEAARLTARLIETGVPYETRMRFTLASGETRTSLLKVNLARDTDGQPVALYGVEQDITEAVRRTNDLSKMVETLKLAEETAGVGHWRLDLANRELTWSDVVYDIHGLPRGADVGGLDAALSQFDDESRERLAQSVKQTALTGEAFSLKLNLQRADGQTRVVVTQGRREVGADGRSSGIIGVIQDVTEHDLAAARIAQSEAQYRGLADRSTDLIISYGLDGIVTYVSPAIRDLKGLEPSEVIGRPVTSLIHPDDVAELSGRLGSFIASGGIGVHPSQYRSLDASGSVRWFEARASLIRDSQGRVTAVQDIVRDVTETKAMEQALIEARDTAESAARSKSEFLANMSHELRTPLNAINGFSEIMSGEMFGPLGDNRYRGYATDILKSGQHLLSLINDILDMAKIEAGKMTLHLEKVSVVEICEDAIRLMRDKIQEAELTLTLDAGEMPDVDADPRGLKQVMLNLISNAVKFTPEGGDIVVRVAQEDDVLRISVTDTGIGIAKEDLERLAKPFEQVEGQHSKTTQGTGLGLALTKSLIEMHSGSMTMDSEPGIGTTVSFTLPLIQPAAQGDTEVQTVSQARAA